MLVAVAAYRLERVPAQAEPVGELRRGEQRLLVEGQYAHDFVPRPHAVGKTRELVEGDVVGGLDDGRTQRGVRALVPQSAPPVGEEAHRAMPVAAMHVLHQVHGVRVDGVLYEDTSHRLPETMRIGANSKETL